MLSFETLACCAACGCHARATEIECPHCGAPMRKADGGFTRTAAAALMGLTAALTAAVPLGGGCADEARRGSDSGSGGEGGATSNSIGNGGRDISSTMSVIVASTYGTGPSTGPATGGMRGCEDEPDFDTCFNCFAYEKPTGYEAYATALLLACACDSTAMPPLSCIDECDMMDPAMDICPARGQVDLSVVNMACFACVDALPSNDECIASFETSCQADPECVGFVADLEGCPP